MTKFLLFLVVLEGYFLFRWWFALKKKRIVSSAIVDKLKREAAGAFYDKKISEREMVDFLNEIKEK